MHAYRKVRESALFNSINVDYLQQFFSVKKENDFNSGGLLPRGEGRGTCPEGSCFLLLRNLLMSGLLEHLIQKNFYAQVYGNDDLVLATGCFVSTVCDHMQVT